MKKHQRAQLVLNPRVNPGISHGETQTKIFKMYKATRTQLSKHIELYKLFKEEQNG